MLVLSKGICNHVILGTTLDDSAGEAFDKVARSLGLLDCYDEHGGKKIERISKYSMKDFGGVHFTEPLLRYKDCNFSFSGLKTAVARYIEKENNIEDQCKSNIAGAFQDALTKHLVRRTKRAIQIANDEILKDTTKIQSIVIGGGVAANHYIRSAIETLAVSNNLRPIFPSLKYCSDNGVMIAWTGLEYFRLQRPFDDCSTTKIRAKWPVDKLT